MTDELYALVNNKTWQLVPRPRGTNIVTGKLIFKHKFHSDGILAHHKVLYDETFSLVVKPTTIRIVLSITTSRAQPIRQLDVKTVYC
jgi:hypothetical protein